MKYIDIPNNNGGSSDKGIPWQDPQEEETSNDDPITISNSGLVIISHYIPMLFERLMLTKGQQFINKKAQYQALFCLQYLVTHSSAAPEYQLPLNKVLCGVDLAEPVPEDMPLPEGAEVILDGLMHSVIQHWKALGNTSIQGLQTTFMQREGRLTDTTQNWHLAVAPGTFDMLLDQLPWSFQTIKHPWMDKPLFVIWR